MNSEFNKIKPRDLQENAIQLIGYDWMLVTAGNVEDYNTMTASWGGLGMLWNKPVVFIFVRPQRYTYEFMEREEFFTCTFFKEEHRDKLTFCGTYSGRDYDKAKEVNLTAAATPDSVYFEESRVVIECKKLYFQDIDPSNFIDKSINNHYPNNDYHRMYIGEITNFWVKAENK